MASHTITDSSITVRDRSGAELAEPSAGMTLRQALAMLRSYRKARVLDPVRGINGVAYLSDGSELTVGLMPCRHSVSLLVGVWTATRTARDGSHVATYRI